MGESFVVPPKAALEEQSRQFQKVAEAEIEELKQSLRYVEIQLARAREESETLNNKINDQQSDLERGSENLAKQVKINQNQARQIEELQAKIESFNNNQRDVLEKNRFKASSYMSEINQREEELGRMRAQLLNNQDEMKLLTVSREQFRQQKEVLTEQVKERDLELEKLRRKVGEQNRLMDSMCMAQKEYGTSGLGEDANEAMERARDDIERAERIARSTNKSSFMGLGEKQPKLMSEEHLVQSAGKSTLQRESLNYKTVNDDAYLQDDSIPAEVFQLIQYYREKLTRSRSVQTQSLILDDFFGEVHKILKDVQMREMARIRNEHSVEIMKLRKNLETRLKQELGVSSSTRSKALNSNKSLTTAAAKENFQAFKASDKFIENEIERQRRALFEENELLKKRLRAQETIIQSGNTEKTKFMEGASWIAKKSHIETEKHLQKMSNVMSEFQRKALEYIIDESIMEMNGREVVKVNQWIVGEVEKEMREVGEKFEGIFENVNFHLKEATKQFNKYK